MSPYLISAYFLPVFLIVFFYLRARKAREKVSLQAAKEAIAASMLQPPSLHPVIDPNICIGCRSCLTACPEQENHAVLGMIRGKAKLVAPANCIGHGACKTACPVGAINLVFGTAERGVDIPVVHPNFETNVPGVFVAGELGGMGLIRNAVEQGRQALESIVKLDGMGQTDRHDLLIVGAGPAGFSASLGAMKAGLNFVTVEQDTLGGTVGHYPRGKLVMTTPAELPIVGKMKFKETSKDQLLEFWQSVEAKTKLKINYGERVEAATALEDGAGFEVQTTKNSYHCRSILLTIGRRGTPRQLGVPGEDLLKVVYRLDDPLQYRAMHVLVVGGGDSALEAAHSIAEVPGTTVTLSYRSNAITRAKLKNREKVEMLRQANRLCVYLESTVDNIGENSVTINSNGQPVTIPNQAVIICAGGILPTQFLRDIGIEIETKFGTA